MTRDRKGCARLAPVSRRHKHRWSFVLLAFLVAITTACTEDPETTAAPDTTLAAADPGGDQTTTTNPNPFCLEQRFPERIEGLPGLFNDYESQAKLDAEAEANGDPLPAPTVEVPDTAALIYLTKFGLFVRFYDRRNDPQPVTANVAATADLEGAYLQPDGVGALDVNGTELIYNGTPGKSATGFNVHVCRIDQIRLTLSRGGVPIPPSEIHLGRSSVALDNPVLLERG